MPIKSDFAPIPIARECYPCRLLSAIWRHFSDNPNKIALVNAKDDSDCVSFGELYAFAFAVAAFLEQNGFSRGDVACVALPNCWEYAAIFLGVAIRGGALSGSNPMFTQNELRQQFVDSKCKVVFSSRQNLERVLSAAQNAPNIQTVVLVESGHSKGPLAEEQCSSSAIVPFGRVLRTEPCLQQPFADCDPDKDVLLLPYSSGTSGPPKGVMTTHTGWGTMISVMMAHLDEHVYAHIAPPYDERAECQLLLLPFFHCYGFGLLNIALLKGSTAVVMAAFEQDLFCSTVERFKIRVLKIVPPVLVFLAKSAKLDGYDFSHVRLLFSGAAPAGNDLLAEIKRRFPHIQIVQSYGMTEMAIAICLPVLDKERHEPVGKLVANLEMKIVDISTREELLERGIPGELVVRGPTVMRGYLGRPKEAAQLVDSEGWLSTGDIAFVDNEGFVHIVDRLKELIKVNGLQVSPSELEDLLLSHPLVQDCAVIGMPDAISGELPMAFIVRKGGGGGTGVGEEDVQQFVRENAVYYKHLKGGVEFVEHIPKSPSGKILRRVLRERVAKRRANHLMKSKI